MQIYRAQKNTSLITSRLHFLFPSRGVSLIEIIVGATIISLILLSLGAIAQFSLNLTNVANERLQAVFLAAETIEALKTMRDSNWTTRITPLNAGTTYYLIFVNDHFETTTVAPALVEGKFNRSLVLANVNRDANDDIAVAGTNDPNTRFVTATVVWTSRNITRTESIKTYIMNIFNN